MPKHTSKAEPVMLVARDYIILADGTRYEKGDELPPEVAAQAARSMLEKK